MGTISPDTFNELKNYVSVRMQQGVPLLDSDWNEMDDIRRFELRTFLKWFVGNGVPYATDGTDGFRVTTIDTNDIAIEAGRCLVGGCEAINAKRLNYSTQRLVKEAGLCKTWNVDEMTTLASPVDNKERIDLVYLDVWERLVDDQEDHEIRNPSINMSTCLRIKREWVVRVAEIIAELKKFDPAAAELKRLDLAAVELLRWLHDKHSGHAYYGLARIEWNVKRADGYVVPGPVVVDLRRTGVTIASLADEIADARGMKGNLGNRLDESLTKGGQLRQHVVANEQIQDDAAITETKVQFSSEHGHTHDGLGSHAISININQVCAVPLVPVEMPPASKWLGSIVEIKSTPNKGCAGQFVVRLPEYSILKVLRVYFEMEDEISLMVSLFYCPSNYSDFYSGNRIRVSDSNQGLIKSPQTQVKFKDISLQNHDLRNRNTYWLEAETTADPGSVSIRGMEVYYSLSRLY